MSTSSLNDSAATRLFPVSTSSDATTSRTKSSAIWKFSSPTELDASTANTTSAPDLHAASAQATPDIAYKLVLEYLQEDKLQNELEF